MQIKPIELAERLGRWAAGRGPLPALLAARLRALIDEGELPPGEPLPPDRALALALAVGRRARRSDRGRRGLAAAWRAYHPPAARTAAPPAMSV